MSSDLEDRFRDILVTHLAVDDPALNLREIAAFLAEEVEGDPCDVTTWVPKDVVEAIHECRVRLSGELLGRLRAAGWTPGGSAVDREIVNWLLNHGANRAAKPQLCADDDFETTVDEF